MVTFFLIAKNDLGEYLYLDEDLINFYFSAPTNLAQQSERYLSAATGLLQSTTYNTAPSVFNLIEVELF
ncbi:hypothetical protein [Pseudoalteromonas sp. SaAl2]